MGICDTEKPLENSLSKQKVIAELKNEANGGQMNNNEIKSIKCEPPVIYKVSSPQITTKQEAKNKNQAGPINPKEIQELYKYEPALCKIEFQILKDGKIANYSGTGFFCEINDDNIPFKRALFTNNHVLNEKRIENGKEIEFEYLKEKKKIKITNERKKFTNSILDYTCIEIFDSDKIKKFFTIDKSFFGNRNDLLDNEFFILQYPNGGDLCFQGGKITKILEDVIVHSVPTDEGSSGSPLIKRYNNILVVGIHFGAKYDVSSKEFLYNVATPFNIIIKDIKNKLINDIKKHNILNNTKIIEPIVSSRNIINIMYEKKNNNFNSNDVFSLNPNNIFGSNFVKNNINNIQIIIKDKLYPLMDKYTLNEGKNYIKIKILKKLTTLEDMFSQCISLKNIDELKYLDTKEVNNFSGVFYGCSSLSNINALQNWNVSKGNDFSAMFFGCSSLSDLTPLQNWDVSNGTNFSYMFCGCSAISNINAIQNTNIFSTMLKDCSPLSNIKALQNWNVSNGKLFSAMFCGCSLLSDITPLKNWNVSNAIEFSGMFWGCKSLSDIKALQNWNVSNGILFICMFRECSSLSDIEVLKNWKTPKGKDFSGMFYKCSRSLNLKDLQNFNVSEEYLVKCPYMK